MVPHQRRAVDTSVYRRRFRLWLLILIWLVAVTIVGAWRLLNEEERQRDARYEERLIICHEDETIKRILRDDLTEQILEEEALLADPSVIPSFLQEATRLSLARHHRQKLALAPRNCVEYARRPPGSR